MTSPAPWSHDPDLATLFAAIEEGGGEARVVGGAVRDWLLGRALHDLDIATTLEPEAVRKALAKQQIRTIPTGIDHGTVTALLNGRDFEITTLRRDVETDGRHAVVSFTKDWREDALRRDFTINTLSANLKGEVFDPLEAGLKDIDRRYLRFAGEARQRIREDYLRILRFFRFQAEIDLAADAEGEAACKKEAEGLTRLSAERIWQEMRKLLAGPNRAGVVERMQGLGVFDVLLPENESRNVFNRLTSADPILALASLLPDHVAAAGVAKRWKLAGADQKRLIEAVVPIPDHASADLGALKGLAWKQGVQAISDRLTLAGKDDFASQIADWHPPPLPLRGQDVLDRGVSPGPEVGELVSRIENWWIAQDFEPDRSACLGELNRLINQG